VVSSREIADLVGCSVDVLTAVADDLRQANRDHVDGGISRLFEVERKRAGYTPADLGRLLGRHRKNVGELLRNGEDTRPSASNARLASAARFFAL
jgi:hypothetical protein